MTFQSHQQRVVAERNELEEKLKKLTTFRLGPIHASLSHQERELLAEQAAAMTLYSSVLARRILLFLAYRANTTA